MGDRLFKVYPKYDLKRGELNVFWATDKLDAANQLTEWYIRKYRNGTLQEIRDEINKKNRWIFKEIKLPNEPQCYNIYKCYIEELGQEGFHVIFAKNQKGLLDILFQMYKSDYKTWVTDFNIDFSFAKQFFYDEKGYLLQKGANRKSLRRDLRKMIDVDEKKLNAYLNDNFVRNVFKFFKHHQSYALKYLKAFSDYHKRNTAQSKVTFPEGMYRYCFEHDREYMRFKVQKINKWHPRIFFEN